MRGWRRSSDHGFGRLRHWGLGVRLILFDELFRQEQRENTALTRFAGDADRTTQQVGQITGNRQPQTCTAITAVGGAVCLTERLKDALLLLGCDADSRIAHGEGNALARLARHGEADLAFFGELDGVG